MTHVKWRAASPVSSEIWRVSAQARIDAQAAIVARLKPGQKDHRIATSVLLLLQDSLFVMTEAKTLVRASKEQTAAAKRGRSA